MRLGTVSYSGHPCAPLKFRDPLVKQEEEMDIGARRAVSASISSKFLSQLPLFSLQQGQAILVPLQNLARCSQRFSSALPHTVRSMGILHFPFDLPVRETWLVFLLEKVNTPNQGSTRNVQRHYNVLSHGGKIFPMSACFTSFSPC